MDDEASGGGTAMSSQRRRSRATMALFAAVGAVVFVGAPIVLHLLTQDRPAVGGSDD